MCRAISIFPCHIAWYKSSSAAVCTDQWYEYIPMSGVSTSITWCLGNLGKRQRRCPSLISQTFRTTNDGKMNIDLTEAVKKKPRNQGLVRFYGKGHMFLNLSSLVTMPVYLPACYYGKCL